MTPRAEIESDENETKNTTRASRKTKHQELLKAITELFQNMEKRMKEVTLPALIPLISNQFRLGKENGKLAHCIPSRLRSSSRRHPRWL